jgi:hypothetical protein
MSSNCCIYLLCNIVCVNGMVFTHQIWVPGSWWYSIHKPITIANSSITIQLQCLEAIHNLVTTISQHSQSYYNTLYVNYNNLYVNYNSITTL